jgi:hypothetical protein
MHMARRAATKVATTIAKTIVTTRPEVVRLSWRTMHVVSPADWVWQIRPGAQPIMGVEVGMQVLPVEAPLVVVIHQVVGIWEVVRQTRGPVVELDGEEVVIVLEGVLDAEV